MSKAGRWLLGWMHILDGLVLVLTFGFVTANLSLRYCRWEARRRLANINLCKEN